MFELIRYGTRIPFMKGKTLFVMFSISVMAVAIVVIAQRGFNFGVDFAGGVQLVVQMPDELDKGADSLRVTLEKMGVKGVTVQEFGRAQDDKKSRDYNVHFAADFLDETLVREAYSLALARTIEGVNPIKEFRFVGLEKAYLTLAAPLGTQELTTLLKSKNRGLLELLEVQPFGRESSNEYQLIYRSVQSQLQTTLEAEYTSASGQRAEIQKIDFVGAKVGADLKLSGILSFVITVVLIFLYIFLRFDLVYAPGVVLALIHDVLITAGLISYFGIEFDLTMVAALLTLAGYSINDTIIVYDRIREVAHSLRGKSFEEIVNIAINQTLSRTIITSGTTFLTATALYLWGGPVLHGFAFAIAAGIVVGAYSSVFIAAPTLLWTNWLKTKERPVRRAA